MRNIVAMLAGLAAAKNLKAIESADMWEVGPIQVSLETEVNSDLSWLNPVQWWTDDITFHWESYANFILEAFAILSFDLVIDGTSYFGIALNGNVQGVRGTPLRLCALRGPNPVPKTRRDVLPLGLVVGAAPHCLARR